ncbi:ABC transporter substrate-binding protein [Salinispira pacifica]|uniref:Iron(III) dicitrate transport system, periplasmic iron-binding protein FecB n=1 Tax=Salinispira pacifica TaxID=1307761 RepID=V5WEI6_9SPIO|nr:ABC transporter substrate-binding protein [Salinispira pacifica]AHC14025.1 Iron(III) dicitrate transport system, periplasmic iron-binding protein FecB [Salinispira pacifica]
MNTTKTYRYGVSVFLLFLVFLSSPLFARGGGERDLDIRLIGSGEAGMTIRHMLGETTIPDDPRRIVVLAEEGLLLDLIELGIKPVFSLANEPADIALAEPDELEGIQITRSAEGISMEDLVNLEPDLIIGHEFFVERGGYNRISRIAPTVVVRSDDPAEAFIQTAMIFGLRDEAESSVEDFRTEFKRAADSLAGRIPSISVATVYPGANIALWYRSDVPVPSQLEALGAPLRPGDEIWGTLRPRQGRAFISSERLDLIDGQILVLLQSPFLEGEMEDLARLTEDPLWQTIPAVLNDRVIIMDRLGYPGFRGQRRLLAELVGILEVEIRK